MNSRTLGTNFYPTLRYLRSILKFFKSQLSDILELVTKYREYKHNLFNLQKLFLPKEKNTLQSKKELEY